MASSKWKTKRAVAFAAFAASLVFTALAVWTFRMPGLIGWGNEPLTSLPYFWYLSGAIALGFTAGVLGARCAFGARRPSGGGLIALGVVWLGLAITSFVLFATHLWLFALFSAPAHATGVLGVALCLRELLHERALARASERWNERLR